MARIRFKVARTYETGGPGKGPHFPEGHVLDESGVAAALGQEVSPEYARDFLDRWVRRGAAEYVDGRTPVTEPQPATQDAPEKKGSGKPQEPAAEVDLEKLTKAELEAKAAELKIDISAAKTKADILAILDLPADLEVRTREELDHIAALRGVDISDAKNKGDVIAALQLAAEAR